MKKYQSFSSEVRFRDLCEAVKHCTLCDRLKDRTKVLSGANGNVSSKVLFIAEAPGRLGADRTGIPLFGDKTGNNFEALLGNIGWKRENIFITNALLCNPRHDNGTNGTPTAEEIENCKPYLEMTIELIQPEVIVTLGSISLNTLAKISPHNFNLKKNVGQTLAWCNRILVPLYHPGPRARVHRSYPKQTSDFIALAKLVDPLKGINRREYPKADLSLGQPSEFQKLVWIVVSSLGKMTYFKLTKLLYLIDLTALRTLGKTVTGEIYLRQQEGPWPPTLKKSIPQLEGREVLLSFRRQLPLIEPGPSPRFSEDFDETALEIITEVLEKYGRMDNKGIKMAVYRTEPMRYILKQEKSGRDMRKIPVIYDNLTATEHDKLSKKDRSPRS